MFKTIALLAAAIQASPLSTDASIFSPHNLGPEIADSVESGDVVDSESTIKTNLGGNMMGGYGNKTPVTAEQQKMFNAQSDAIFKLVGQKFEHFQAITVSKQLVNGWNIRVQYNVTRPGDSEEGIK